MRTHELTVGLREPQTVAFSVAYLTEGPRGLEVTVRDDTIRYLRLRRGTATGAVPPATGRRPGINGPSDFGEASYELETIDFKPGNSDVIGQPGDPVGTDDETTPNLVREGSSL